MTQLIGPAGQLGWVAAKAALLFLLAVTGFRLGERRTFAQLNAFDFAVAVALGAIIGRTSTSSTTSFLAGAVALLTLLLAHRAVTVLRRRLPIARVIDQPPNLLVLDGELRTAGLARAGLTVGDVYALLRQHGVEDLREVGVMLYESRGGVSLHRAGTEPGPLMRDALAACLTRG
ncbi:MAG TPA: YetF domain-containing protein [Jatrophihabitans sp.]|nr:YetF domain-containing protein [Jatrophihabitans sp.]